jgi:hypothetical protein
VALKLSLSGIGTLPHVCLGIRVAGLSVPPPPSLAQVLRFPSRLSTCPSLPWVWGRDGVVAIDYDELPWSVL